MRAAELVSKFGCIVFQDPRSQSCWVRFRVTRPGKISVVTGEEVKGFGRDLEEAVEHALSQKYREQTG